MLDVVRKIRRADQAICNGLWSERTQTSKDVVGSTAGVISPGQIGPEFVVRVRAFGTRVLVYMRTQDQHSHGTSDSSTPRSTNHGVR